MLKEIKTENFPGVADGVYKLGLLNRIAGPNGSGKSSLFRAALWAKTGLLPDGSEAGSAYEGATVTIAETLQDGRTVRRSRKNRRTTIELNGRAITAEEYDASCKMPHRAFACMMFPMTFFSLSDQQKREVFLSITPEVSREALLRERLGGILDRYPEVEWNLPSKKLFEHWGNKRKSCERELARLQGELEGLRRAYEAAPDTIEGEDKATLLAQRDALFEQIRLAGEKQKETEALWEAFTRYNADLIIFDRQRSALSAWENLQKMKPADAPSNADELREKMDKALEAHAEQRSQLVEIERTGIQLAEEIKRTENAPRECPACKRPFEAEQEGDRQAYLDVLKIRKADLAKQFTETKKAFDLTHKKFTKAQSDYKAAVAKGGAAVAAPRPEVPPEPQAPTWEGQPVTDATVVRELREKSAAAVLALGSQVAVVDEKLRRNGTEVKTKAAITASAEKAKREMAELKSWAEEAKVAEAAFHPTTGIDATCLQAKLEQVVMPGFVFQFVERLQNGTEKDCFKVTRDDGTPLELLSSGQKIKFGLALAKLIAALTKAHERTVFVEGADIVDSIPQLPGFQMSVERVDKSLPGLAVEIKKEFGK